MISRLKGLLISRGDATVEVETPGGVVYEVEIPTTVLERLPLPGQDVELRTVQVVREDSLTLYGFLEAKERDLFARLLTASGVGAKLALAMLSTFRAPRLAQALAEKDLAALTQVSGVGKKKAERIVLELADKVQDLAVVREGALPVSAAADGAVQGLVALGYAYTTAEALVRSALKDDNELSTEELIRKALAEE